MRLGARFLTVAALAAPTLVAQGHRPLPWENLQPMDWQAMPGAASTEPYLAAPSTGPAEARLTPDGTLSIRDGRGIIRLQTGLAGRLLYACTLS